MRIGYDLLTGQCFNKLRTFAIFPETNEIAAELFSILLHDMTKSLLLVMIGASLVLLISLDDSVSLLEASVGHV